MSRLHACAFLIGTLQVMSCAKPVAPVASLTAEERAAVGTYTLTLANGRTLPTNIGRFISTTAGADVAVTGATLVLRADTSTRSSASITVTVEYTATDPGQGFNRTNGMSYTSRTWSLSGSTLSVQAGDPAFVITAGSLSGRTITITTTVPGLYGAVSPTVMLTLTKQ